MTKQTEFENRLPVAAADTVNRDSVFDCILRKQLTDKEAAQIARLATTHISNGKITPEAQVAHSGDALQAAQHALGVRPALTGVREDPNQPGVLALTRKPGRPTPELEAGIKELDGTKLIDPTDIQRSGHESGRG